MSCALHNLGTLTLFAFGASPKEEGEILVCSLSRKSDSYKLTL